jgi:hypothetical protein
LGHSRLASLTLFLVLARIAHQGSRLSAVRWARDHAVKAVLGLGSFDEEDLYAALDWAAEQQAAIEQRLYRDYVKAHYGFRVVSQEATPRGIRGVVFRDF